MYTTEELKQIATNVRRGILEQVYTAKSGHPGGALSCADILTAIYFNLANVDPQNPDKEDRDRIILSKGHASAALYSVLANRGYFDVEELKTFRKLHSGLQGHPSLGKLPGVDMTSGSLGQGLSIANGMALAEKLDNKGYYTYAILGDGEIEEGQIWEAAMTASKYNRKVGGGGSELMAISYSASGLGPVYEKDLPFMPFGRRRGHVPRPRRLQQRIQLLCHCTLQDRINRTGGIFHGDTLPPYG